MVKPPLVLFAVGVCSRSTRRPVHPAEAISFCERVQSMIHRFSISLPLGTGRMMEFEILWRRRLRCSFPSVGGGLTLLRSGSASGCDRRSKSLAYLLVLSEMCEYNRSVIGLTSAKGGRMIVFIVLVLPRKSHLHSFLAMARPLLLEKGAARPLLLEKGSS